MNNTLHDKVILITGGAKRVGAAISRLLHGDGARVVIHYRSSVDEAKRLEEELNNSRPGSASIVQANLLELTSLQTLVQTAVQQFGRLDVLINNASSYYPTQIGKIGEPEWDDLVGTNLRAPLFLSQAAAPELKKQQGCIINITDMHVERPKKGYVVYNIAKGGLITLTRALAQDLAPEVRVNAVAPGPVLWPEDNPQFDENYRQTVINQTLLKRLGEPEDVARAVRFLIQDAPFTTGQIIAVDGGRSLSL